MICFRIAALLILLPVVSVLSVPDAEAYLPPDVREFLIQELHFTEKQVAAVEMGKGLVAIMKTEKREEIALFGLIRVEAPTEFFVSKFRNIVKFESGRNVLQSGVFRSPPERSDVASLTWEPDDLEQIRKCKRNDCGVRLPQGSVLDLKAKVNWSSRNAHRQANDLLRQRMGDLVKAYQSVGDRALPVYAKNGKFIRVKDGFHLLLRNSRLLNLQVPELISYLRDYPDEKNPGAEDLFYWQKGEFGLQPVIRISHVVILKMDRDPGTSYAIASKMLYANHYLRDGLEVRLLLSDSCAGCGFYLLVINRSHVDGMTGFKGWFVRGSTVKKSVASLEKWLSKIKMRMEKDFQRRAELLVAGQFCSHS